MIELLSKLLAKNGLLLLTTGNLHSPLAWVLGLGFPYCVPEIHVSYFNPELLSKIYVTNGLVPVRVRFSENLRFKFLKNLPKSLSKRFADRLSASRILLGALDWFYGVSDMPCATKR